MEAMVERCRDRNKTQFAELCQLRAEIDQEKWKSQGLLEEQESRISKQNLKFLEQERKEWESQHARDTRKLGMQIEYLQGELKRAKRSKEYIDLKICLFKWR